MSEMCKDCTQNPNAEEFGMTKEEQLQKDLELQAETIGYLRERIKELEKENAELKEQLEMSNKVYNGNLDYSHHIEGQLTKAKEIIEKVAKMYRYSPRVDEIIEQAEQFLSEVEK